MKKTLLAAMTLTAAIALNSPRALAHPDHEEEAPGGTPKQEQPKEKKTETPPDAHGHSHSTGDTNAHSHSAPADSHGHSHSTKIPDTVEGIWKEIHKQQAQLVRLVEEKKLASAHDPAFAIRDLVKALPGKVAAESKAKAEEGAKEIAKIATDIDKSGAAGAQKTTEANVKKMGEAIKTLEAKLKPVETKK